MDGSKGAHLVGGDQAGNQGIYNAPHRANSRYHIDGAIPFHAAHALPYVLYRPGFSSYSKRATTQHEYPRVKIIILLYKSFFVIHSFSLPLSLYLDSLSTSVSRR